MKLGGPQGDRDRLFWEDKADVPGVVRDDIAINDADDTERRAVEGEMFRLKRENGSLKDQLQRALRELKAYQLKYPSAYVPPAEGDDDLPPWTASPEITTPLFIAYDARKYEKICLAAKQF